MADPFPDEEEDIERERQEKVRKHLEHEQWEYWRSTLDTYAGRAVVWDILEMCGVYRDIAPGKPQKMGHSLGMRHIGLRVLTHLLTVDVKSYTTMREEAHARLKRAEQL